MKIVLQRVRRAKVSVGKEIIGEIEKGYLIFLGIGETDTKEIVNKYVDKIIKLRLFEDENGKTNLSLKEVKGELLAVSQFTLYADVRKGNRPSFMNAALPEMAEELYQYFVERCRENKITTQTGRFGAEMQVSLVNDGPFTIILDDQSVLKKP